jgi:O-methyltransferase involved in polyketide biosynthesis
VLFESLQPANRISRAFGGPTLEAYLLARHRAIDALLENAIERGGIDQVVEVAAGLSPRGWRFAQRYGEQLTYVEADLPDLAARKRRALAPTGTLGPAFRVVAVDALRDHGPGSLGELAAELDPARGLAVVTEGLLGYLSSADVAALWRRIAGVLQGFAHGRYLSDLHLAGHQTPAVRSFRLVLSAFVRGRVHLHFATADAAERALAHAGFAQAHVRPAGAIVAGQVGDPGMRLAHIIEASTK